MIDAPLGRFRLPERGWREARLVDIIGRTPTVKSFVLQPPQPMPFIAGQHAEVRLTAPDGYRAQRSYSISSAPEAPEAIELTIEQLDDGEVSPFLHEVAEIGDAIEIRGPLGGHFIWSVDEGGPILLIGAGSGVAPLMSMIRHRAAQGSAVPMLLLFSARSWDDLIFREELLALDARRDGFEAVFTLTREPARRPSDHSRRIDTAMIRDVLGRLGASPARVYVCGSNPFVETAAEGVLAAGVAPDIVRTERYGV